MIDNLQMVKEKDTGTSKARRVGNNKHRKMGNETDEAEIGNEGRRVGG
jgi:hypothetical protein